MRKNKSTAQENDGNYKNIFLKIVLSHLYIVSDPFCTAGIK